MGAFDDKKPPVAKSRVGLKLKNDNSMFANTPKKPTQQQINQSVKEEVQQSQAYIDRAAELTVAFKSMLEDKTLSQNKGPFAPDLEKEAIGKLMQLAIDMNLDENEDAGMGSIGLIAFLFRCLLIQRDKLNTLDYAVYQLENQMKSLQSMVLDEPKKSE